MDEPVATKAWAKIRLEDCCEEIGQRIECPAESGYDRFVGLEHLETGETMIRNWGSTEDVTSSMKLFKAGDVIVARRNVYLRRASRAEFDGVCSGDGIVLRPKANVCIPELLPFLINTDGFWNYVSSQADGTMSKRITVKRLMAYEFTLPPPEEQRRIARACSAATALHNCWREASNRLLKVTQAAIDDSLAGFRSYARLIQDVVDVGALAPPQDGNHGDKHPKSSDYTESGIPFVMAADIENGSVDLLGCKFIAQELADSLRVGFAREGDVLLTHKGVKMGQSAILRGTYTEYVMLTPQVTYYRVLNKDRLLPEYLCYAFRSSSFQQQFFSQGRQSTRPYVGITKQSKLEVPIPPIEKQKQMVALLGAIEDGYVVASERYRAASALTAAVVQRGLSPGAV